MVFAFGS